MAQRDDKNKTINNEQTMTLNNYQEKAMATCLPSCNNDVYALNGMQAEVGEIADKVAKWVRKGICKIESNHLVFNTSDESVVAGFRKELAKELGDVLWFIALMSKTLGYELEEVAQMNIDKLRDRAQRGVIDGNGDNR